MEIMNAEIQAKNQTYAGVFMVTLATLMYEILLTRIFSVTMWYHFAFMAISIALFGMTVGGILVYLFPNYFTQERVKYHLALNSLLFAISIVLSFLVHLGIPFITDRSVEKLYSIALTYVVISVPFVFSGICVCLTLTKFPRQVSKLYAANLAGGAIGCVLLIYTLNITDGPTAVIVIAFLACIGSIFFVAKLGFSKLRRAILICSIIFAFLAVVHTIMVAKQMPLLRLMVVKGKLEDRPLYEKWNSFSRIRIWGDPNKPEKPFGWGISATYPSDYKIKQLHMNIDAAAYTSLTAFDGDLSKLEYLKYEVVNLVHYIRHNSNVLVVGTGGGRDILSALVFEQKSVLGVEINKVIIDAVNQKFGDFTGHLDKNPKVTFVNDEARSYIARSRDKFDIIQISLTDTWAATSAGAFVLTENSLYTVEAWKIFLSRLSHNGILTVSRWYFLNRPGEMYRLTSLATASLKQSGVEKPREHIVIVRYKRIGTILVSKEPFSDKELDSIEQIARKMQFVVMLTPRFYQDYALANLASGKTFDGAAKEFAINTSAPTDDSPFFFNMLRLQDIFNLRLWDKGKMSFNMKAVYILGILLIIVIGLTFLCIIVPLILTTKKASLRGVLPLFIFFACIGLGFMLVEISQMQRLIIFLGHPTYGLSVVLFVLLLSSGLGSYSTQMISNPNVRRSAVVRLILLICALAIFGMFTPYAINVFQGSIIMFRILIAIVILFPIGLFMGMAFPLGMKIASIRAASVTPWLWGINGATSVCASVLAVVIALSSSISTTFWIGFFCYVVATIAFVLANRGQLISNIATNAE